MSFPELAPGDVLLYRGRSVWSWLIRVKTWAPVSHVELVARAEDGHLVSLASRDGQGVGTYRPIRIPDLYAVLRPARPLHWEGVWAYHRMHVGDDYDWWGLLRFFTIGRQSEHKAFCSEYVTRLLRHGGLDPFAVKYDADLVSPGMFLASPVLDEVWRVGR